VSDRQKEARFSGLFFQEIHIAYFVLARDHQQGEQVQVKTF